MDIRDEFVPKFIFTHLPSSSTWPPFTKLTTTTTKRITLENMRTSLKTYRSRYVKLTRAYALDQRTMDSTSQYESVFS